MREIVVGDKVLVNQMNCSSGCLSNNGCIYVGKECEVIEIGKSYNGRLNYTLSFGPEDHYMCYFFADQFTLLSENLRDEFERLLA